MQNILAALAKWRPPAAVRSVSVDLDDADQYTVTIRMRKSAARSVAATYRISYRDELARSAEFLTYRLIEACNTAWAAPEPPPDPPVPAHPHPKRHARDDAPTAA